MWKFIYANLYYAYNFNRKRIWEAVIFFRDTNICGDITRMSRMIINDLKMEQRVTGVVRLMRFYYLPTLSIVRLSSSSYSCIVSWQLTFLLLHSLAISPSFTSVFVLILRSTFDSGRADVFNFSGLSSSGSAFSDWPRLDERTKEQSSFSGVREDTGFVEIFIVSKFSRLLLWLAWRAEQNYLYSFAMRFTCTRFRYSLRICDNYRIL
jgi:hypothetical protein